MEHFIAYHSVKKMGYSYELTKSFLQYSRKGPLLQKAIGNLVWIIQGEPNKNKTRYTLCGVYIGERVTELMVDGQYQIASNNGFDFIPRISLNECEWWPLVLKEQSNFSLGFNKIKNLAIVNALTKLLPLVEAKRLGIIAADSFEHRVLQSLVDDADARKERIRTASNYPTSYHTTVTVFNRNPDVVAEVLLRANGVCEECNQKAPFNRATDGSPYLEVHHKIQLAHGGEDTVTNAIALCPNCHRKAHYG